MKNKYILQLILLAAIWGSSYLFMKMIVPTIGIFVTIGTRFIIAAIILFIVLMVSTLKQDFISRWKDYTILTLLNLIIPFSLITYSVLHLNSSTSAILNATTPMFALLVTRISMKERITISKVAGLVAGFAGIAILVGPHSVTAVNVLAVIAALIAALCYAIGTVYARLKFQAAHPVKTVTGQFLYAAVLFLPIVFFKFETKTISHTIVIPLLILAVICTAFGYTLYFRLLEKIGPLNISMVTILIPIFSLIWGSIFLDEKISAVTLAGMVMILLGLALVMNKINLRNLPARSI